MASKDNTLKAINRIGETHFFLKPVIVNSLKKFSFDPQVASLANNKSTYYEYWVSLFNDKFYDMGTLIRLGSEIECGLKYYYMEKRNLKNLVELKADPRYELNIFQRIMPWTTSNAISLFNDQLKYDLNTNPFFKEIQELMLFRHLYAHNNGLLNEKFLTDYQKLTGTDIASSLDPKYNYPEQDTYYFKPLDRLSQFIESSKKLFSNLP